MTEKNAKLSLRLLHRMSTKPEEIPECVPEFIELVSDHEITGLEGEALELLADLAHDLNWYQADPRIRRKEGELWDERTVLEEVKRVLAKLGEIAEPL